MPRLRSTSGRTLPTREWLSQYSQARTEILSSTSEADTRIKRSLVPSRVALASDPALLSLEVKTVKIAGPIELYKGKPEIKIPSKEQIEEE
jgi:hypothetical protein